jgi:O-antigen/teichoic acid export membrane protein
VTAARRWIAEHWDLTGFMLFEALLLLGAYNGVVFYIAGHGELAGVGALRAAQVVNGPIQLLAASVFAFAVPELVRRPHLRDRHPLLVAGSIGASVAAAAALWNGALFLIPPEIGERLLGDSWTGMREVLPAVALGAIGNVIAVGPAVVTYAIGDSRTAFRIHFGVAALIVVGGGAGYHLDGVVGMALGVALAYWLPLPAWYLSLRSHRRFLQAAGTQPAG